MAEGYKITDTLAIPAANATQITNTAVMPIVLAGDTRGHSTTASVLSRAVQGVRTVIASRIAGINLNSNVLTGGGTDDTTVIQAAITGGNIKLVMDGASLVSGLDLSSNTTIECLDQGCGFYLKNNSDRSIIHNANITQNATAIQDENLTFIGGTYNGNQDNQNHNNSVTNEWVSCIAMFGVRNVRVRDVYFYKPRTFAFWLSNWEYVWVSGSRVNVGNVGGANYDGWHFNKGRVAIISGTPEKTFDDKIAFNADEPATDGVNPLPTTFFGAGEITDCIVQGLVFDGTTSGIRILSGTHRVDRMSFQQLRGTTQYQWLIIDNYSEASLGSGNIGEITISDVDIAINGSGYKSAYAFLSCNIETLKLNAYHRSDFTQATYPTVLQNAGTINQLMLNGLSIHDTLVYSDATNHITLNGVVKQLSACNTNWFTTPFPTGFLFAGSGTVTAVSFSNYVGPKAVFASTLTIGTRSGDASITSIPVPLHLSRFVASNGTALASYTPDAGNGFTSNGAGSATIQSNQAVVVSAADNPVFYTDVAATDSIVVCKVISPPGTGQQIWFRYVNSGPTGLIILSESGSWKLYKALSGSYTELQTLTGTLATHTFTIYMRGDVITIYIDDTLAGTYTITDAALRTGTRVGLGSFSSATSTFNILADTP